MRKILFISCFLICFSISHAQKNPKLLVKIMPSQTEVTLYTRLQMNAWLYNKGKRPISIFRQDFTAPAWFGVIEHWYCTFKQKKDTFPELMETPTSGYNENNIIDLMPGDSMMTDTFGYTFYEPGSYSFTYNILASRQKVKRFYAMTLLARKKMFEITEFNVTSKPITIECKPAVISDEKIMDLPLKEIIKNKKQFCSLDEAFKNPEEVFILGVEGYLEQRDLKAINLLKNIHSLQLSHIKFFKYDDKLERLDTLIFDLHNLKELAIDNSQIEITDSFLIKFPKLEKILLINVSYHNPSKALNKLTSIKSIIMKDCQINSWSADFSKLKNLVRLELNTNNLKEFPPIIKHPKLEYIDIQENKLTTFPDIFNNPSLKKIYLARNKITTLPTYIRKSKTLIHMDLSWNNISVIPPQIAKLKKLTVLKLSGNQISHLPKKIKRLSKLQVLFLDDNNYSTVDPFIFKISKLEQLVLSKNNITILPNSFGKLSLLVQLDIADNKISQLPKSLLRSKKLNVLNVKGNTINENKISRKLRTKLKSGYLH